MTINELGSIGELVGGIAVFVSLIYVGLQIRQSNRAAQATARRESSSQFNELSFRVMTDPQLRAIYGKITSGKSWSTANNDEKVMVNLLLRSIFNTVSLDYAQMELGVSDVQYWPQVWDWLAFEILPHQIVHEWWRLYVEPANSYSKGFRDMVSNEISKIDHKTSGS